jgi:cell division protein FtsI/penicillin-binding protein 2
VTPKVLLRKPVEKEAIEIDAKNLKIVQEGMRMAVTEPIGSGKALNVRDVSVAAKSGTAELGVSKELVNSWISGYFPYEKPRYAFVVIMEKGSRHNTVGASYVMRQMLEWMRDNTEYTKELP